MTTFDELFSELSLKAQSGDSNSQTVKWLAAGVHTIGKKVVEEAAEVWMAAEFQTKDDLALEISQLIYHVQVMMLAKGLTISDIEEKF